MHLPDINVWLALAFKRHKHHPAAMAWFSSIGPGPCCFCRITQMGLLRLASNPQVMQDAAVTLDQAWLAYDAFSADPRVGYVEEPAGIEPIWRSLTSTKAFSPKLWNDAYLAAFANVAGFEVVTFDQAFAQFPAVRCTILP